MNQECRNTLSSDLLFRRTVWTRVFGPWGQAERSYKRILRQRTHSMFVAEWKALGYEETQAIEAICQYISEDCLWLPNLYLFPGDDLRAVTVWGSSAMYEISLPLTLRNEVGADPDALDALVESDSKLAELMEWALAARNRL